jgi:signal transduction histidine kinase
MSAGTILTIVGEAVHADVRAALGVVLPEAAVERVEPGLVRRLPPASALVVDDAQNARLARATGFASGIIIVGEPESDEVRAAFSAQGTQYVGRALDPAGLADALTRVMTDVPGGSPDAARAALERARRLLAAGEIACGLQHAFNNPLAALMAEAQLLEMEAPNDEVRETAGRLLVQVRRLTELSRSLDAVRDRPSVRAAAERVP